MRNLYCFIVNKASANGRSYKIWKQVELILQQKKIPYIVRFTQRPKHATLLVQEAILHQNPSVIVAVGGDGTVHEVINGLADSNIPLGVIPAGSGNDFCRGLGIPLQYKKALQLLFNGERTEVDVGRFHTKYVSTVVGVGFDAEVARATNSSSYKKWLNVIRLGSLSYIVSMLKVLFYYKPADISLKIDSVHYNLQNVWLIAIANTPYYGGGLMICPKAHFRDGLFSICLVHGLSRWQFLGIFLFVFNGKHTSFSSVVKVYEGKEIEIHSFEPLMVHGDGEILGQIPARLTIQSNSLSVIL